MKKYIYLTRFMGHKIHPTAFRLGYSLSWFSNSFPSSSLSLFSLIHSFFLAFNFLSSYPVINYFPSCINISLKLWSPNPSNSLITYSSQLLKNFLEKHLNVRVNFNIQLISHFSSDAKIFGDYIALNYSSKPLRSLLLSFSRPY